MTLQPDYDDSELLLRLREGRKDAMSAIFRKYYSEVCKAIIRVVQQPETSEDIAQEVFYELWRKREELQITTSLRAYLRRAAMNRSLNFLRDQRLQFEDVEQQTELESPQLSASDQLESAELEQLIQQAIQQLPDRCRAVFLLSRFEDLTYREIAEKLEISEKTVENQISKALKLLRHALNPFVHKGLLATLWLLKYTVEWPEWLA